MRRHVSRTNSLTRKRLRPLVGLGLEEGGRFSRHAVAVYAIRTFTPPHPRTFMCCVVGASRQCGATAAMDFVELAQRNKYWAPVAVRGDAGMADVVACPRCSRMLDGEEAAVPSVVGMPSCQDCRRT
ncbi:Usp36 [Symbiodinium natans]|uniref:Usp36 protein n=1 Tax=Symbiodinium natans TaxID=878477 RepID=A0A812UFV7_9DINO|nr:Usp36 [Symbiodinium natans]